MEKKPKLIAFDLDYTLWPFWVDTHVDPPFHVDKNGKIKDSSNKHVKPYKEAAEVLQELHSEGYIIAVASRTGEIQGANQLLSLYDWDKFISYKEIYPGCKIHHFERIKANSGVDFKDMLFFDDELRNKIDMDKIGVLMYLVKDGISKKVLKEGLEKFAERNSP